MTLSGSRGTGSGTHRKIFSTTAAIPELRKGFRDGCGISRRGRNRRVRAPARYVVPDQWDFRGRSEGAWPRLGLDVAPAESLRPRRPTRRPLVARRSLSIHRLARGSSRVRVNKETTDDTRWKGNAQGQELPSDDNNLQKQIRAAVKQALQVKQQEKRSKGAKAKDGGANCDWVAILVMSAQFAFVTLSDVSRQVKVGGLRSLR